MATRSQDETALREYLLGTLPEPLWEEIETKLLTDENFAETVDLIEDELIDDYLERRLARTERRALENHFVRAPEHRQKLEFARLLRSHLRTPEKSVPLGLVPGFRSPALYRFLAAGFACLLVVTVGLAVYTVRLRHELASEMEKSRRSQAALEAMVEERVRVALLGKKPDPNTEIAATYRPLRLDLLATQTRESGDMRSIDCSPGTSSIEVHIALVNGALSSYDAVLYGPGDRKLWAKAGISPVTLGPGKQLLFSMPNSLPCNRQYSLGITGKGESPGANYAFRVRALVLKSPGQYPR